MHNGNDAPPPIHRGLTSRSRPNIRPLFLHRIPSYHVVPFQIELEAHLYTAEEEME